jgi:choline dehydrogenase
VLKACVQAGIPPNPDFNAQQEGCGYYQTTTLNRRRWSAAQAYLRVARKRPNLVIRTGAHATRVLFESNRAVGVEFHTRKAARPLARGEIVVSGGALARCSLLSGLGRTASTGHGHHGGPRHARRRFQSARPFQPHGVAVQQGSRSTT